ncbi:MAG TPA: glycoside hydrolase family 16 protein [Flavisolibacter sp.]|nr:glycoside hydrolase family 16 protein [Flavisolibacter sp.]
MKQLQTLFFLLLFLFTAVLSKAQYKNLIWADEFNYQGVPDSTKWDYDTGGHGWGNNELQFYTKSRLQNARVENGNLIIEAIKETYEKNGYTSARIISKNKGDWKYGRIEVRARLPKGKGIWPAIWMLPTNWVYGNWPKSGEIDIMENVGYLPDSVFGSVHTAAFNHGIGTQKTGGVLRKDLSDSFHVYAIEWTTDRIKFYVDSELYHQFINNKSGPDAWPFDQEFHLLLNIAVGGNWGGKYGVDENIFPQIMQIDYVRVYQ